MFQLGKKNLWSLKVQSHEMDQALFAMIASAGMLRPHICKSFVVKTKTALRDKNEKKTFPDISSA